MTTPTIYFAANEDEAMVETGGGSVVTTSGYFRASPPFARCALQLASGAFALSSYWQNQLPFAATSFWSSQRVHCTASSPNGGATCWSVADVNGVKRLAVITSPSTTVVSLVKYDATGAVTTLATGLVIGSYFNSAGIDKWDFFVDYAVSGQFAFYVNGGLALNYTGDVTTNSVTSLSYVRPGVVNASGTSNWSEIIISDTDTRSWNLMTLQPVANGNTHNFDTGTPAAANVNEITLDDSTFDGSTTAGQIDQYTIPALPTGYSIVAFGVSARMAKGATGPTKMDLGVRSGGSDYWSADQTLVASLENYQNWWATDPNTSAPWLTEPSNIGLKSVT